LPSLLARLDRWLSQHRKRYHDGLRPGAGPERLEHLERELGRPLPDELRAWLGWHDGQSDELIGALVETWTPLSAEQIAQQWREQQQEKPPGWKAEWIPLLDDTQGDLVVLDPTQPGHPLREVWSGRDDHPVTAPSLLAWLADFVRDVEAGRYREDTERGEFRKA
jgi:cell wall assembly regulator SMI1